MTNNNNRITTIILGIMTVFIFNACGDGETVKTEETTKEPSSTSADEKNDEAQPPSPTEDSDGEGETPEPSPTTVSPLSENILLKKILTCGDSLSYTYFQYKQNTTACQDAQDSMCVCEVIQTTTVPDAIAGTNDFQEVLIYRTVGSRKDCQTVYDSKKLTAECTENVIRGESLRYN